METMWDSLWSLHNWGFFPCLWGGAPAAWALLERPRMGWGSWEGWVDGESDVSQDQGG